VRRKTFTLACGALALALGAAAEEQGRVLGIRAHGDDRASSVEIDGDRPLSFTTMKLLSPPRVVVDFADAEIAAEERELEIEDGTLRRAAIAQAGLRTVRIVIELSVDAEFDVRADGKRVEVRVPRPGAVATADAPADGEAEKVASLPKVSLVGSKPPQPPEDAAASRPRTPAEKAEALKKTLAEQRHREAEEKAARKLGRKSGAKVAMKQPAQPQPKPAPEPAVDSAAKTVAAMEPPTVEPPPAMEPPAAPKAPAAAETPAAPKTPAGPKPPAAVEPPSPRTRLPSHRLTRLPAAIGSPASGSVPSAAAR